MGTFSKDMDHVVRVFKEAFKAKEKVLRIFGKHLNAALDEFKGKDKEFALSIREEISLTIATKLGLLEPEVEPPKGRPTTRPSSQPPAPTPSNQPRPASKPATTK